MEEVKLQKLRATIATLRKELDRTRDRFDRTRREIRTAEERIAELARNLRSANRKIDAQYRKVAELEAQRRQVNASVDRQRDQLARQVRAAYATGQQEYLRLLLNQESPAALGRMVSYYDYFNRARSERIGELQATLSKLESLRAEVNAETERLKALRADYSAEKEKLEAVRRERAVLLLKLKRDISTKDERLATAKADAKELEAVLSALRTQVGDTFDAVPAKQPFKRLQGKLNWPVKGALQARFGTSRAQGQLRWEGVLIRAGHGQEVRAVARGRVAFADWLRGYGLLMVIDHGDGYMSLYGHNQSLFKETGDWVDANEVVAVVGDSGAQETEALYFEIRHKGKPLDPVKWCRRGRG